MDTAVIIAIIGAFSTIFVSVLLNYLSKKNTLMYEERKLKQEYYLRYIRSLSENINSEDRDAVISSNHAFNDLLMVASPKVLAALYYRQNLIIDQLKGIGIEKFEEKSYKALTDLVKEMRIDLYGKKQINNNTPNTLFLLQGVLEKKEKES